MAALVFPASKFNYVLLGKQAPDQHSLHRLAPAAIIRTSQATASNVLREHPQNVVPSAAVEPQGCCQEDLIHDSQEAGCILCCPHPAGVSHNSHWSASADHVVSSHLLQ